MCNGDVTTGCLSIKRGRYQVAAENISLYSETLLLLGAAVVAAPLFKSVGLGTVLGYLTAGIMIGPVGRLIVDSEEILQVAELGVVFLLFVIGLELKPARLWALRRNIFGLGLAQVVVTGLVLCLLIMLIAGFSWQPSLVIGFGLALSSTAFALQLLQERGDTNRVYGQTSFSILLFQDIAIVPLLALIPLFSLPGGTERGSPIAEITVAVAAIAGLLIAGRYLLNPLFRIIANTGAREVMIAAALLVVIGSAMLMQSAGLSMAMGAFIAGVLLADSTYRHELEADIEPFRGILLGLFFIAVGLSLDLAVVLDNWLLIILAVPSLMVIKAVIVFVLCRMFQIERDTAIRVAFLLPQSGEFGFVLFSTAVAAALIDTSTASLLVAIVTLSMALTPLSAPLANVLIGPEKDEEMEEDFHGAGSDVLMIGFSRFGQIASQMLLSGGSDVTIIDHSADRVRSAAKFGFRIYFGDGTRKDVLESAGIRRAKIVAVCTHKREITDKVIDLIQSEFPQTRIFTRSYDRTHTLSLRARGVEFEERETFESGLRFGRVTLQALGMADDQAHAIQLDVRKRDEERLAIQAAEGIYAGSEKWHTRPVTPEPLIKPSRESQRIDKVEEQDT